MIRESVVKRMLSSSLIDQNYYREVDDADVPALETVLGSIERVRASVIFFLFILVNNTVMGSDRQSLPIILAPEAELSNQLNSSDTHVSGVSSNQSYSQNVDRRVQQDKLEDLYKKGLISKEVFDERSSPKPLTFEQRLERLKGLRDKGLISKEVYESRQKELLDANL